MVSKQQSKKQASVYLLKICLENCLSTYHEAKVNLCISKNYYYLFLQVQRQLVVKLLLLLFRGQAISKINSEHAIFLSLNLMTCQVFSIQTRSTLSHYSCENETGSVSDILSITADMGQNQIAMLMLRRWGLLWHDIVSNIPVRVTNFELP